MVFIDKFFLMVRVFYEKIGYIGLFIFVIDVIILIVILCVRGNKIIGLVMEIEVIVLIV